MMEALEQDPYAAYLDPDVHRMQQEDLGGSFQGIGARVAYREGQVVVLAPLPGTPAERAGVRSRDIIMEVDGESTLGMNLYEVVMLIRGPRGTSVSLGIRHPGEDKTVKNDPCRLFGGSRMSCGARSSLFLLDMIRPSGWDVSGSTNDAR